MTRFVYIDEAGISNPDQEPFVVVAAVIVDADRKLNELESRIERLVDRHIPADQRRGFVFHAMHLFNGGGPVFDRKAWPRERRWKIAEELASIPKKMDLPLAFGIVQRSRWPLSPDWDTSKMTNREKVVGQHVTAYMSCIMEVEMWMRGHTKNEVTMMIVEDNDQARKMIKEQQNAHRRKQIMEHLPPDYAKYFPFKKIKSSPLFEAKEDSPALQIADFCAYVMKRRAMNDAHYCSVFSALHPQSVAHALDDSR